MWVFFNLKKYILMKSKTNFIQNTMMRKLFIPLMMLVGMVTASQAQETPLQRPQPKLWFGVSGAATLNYYHGTIQTLNANVYAPTAFHKGFGVAPYGSAFFEYRPNPVFGLMFNLAFDDRSGKFDEQIAPCNCPEDLKTNVKYLTMEPSLRIAPFSNGFYVFAGPIFSDGYKSSFTYTQVQQPDQAGNFSEFRKWKIGAQVGAGYDIPLSSKSSLTQVNLAPFIAYRPDMGEWPRTWNADSWSMQGLRLGLALKFGKAKKPTEGIKEVAPVVVAEIPPVAVVVEPEIKFSVYSPTNVPVERNVRETFPVRNYVFFDLGSTEIPSRYVLIRKDKVKDFKENQLEDFPSMKVSDRSKREMVVYYNVLNILGDRMQKNPKTTVILVGSSMQGLKDAKLMAESVKKYLVDVWAIDPKRISIESRIKPKIPSEQSGGKLDLVMLREGDRRVSIESKSPKILMVFQSGSDAPLKPVEFTIVKEAPEASYVTFTNDGAKGAFTSYMIEMADENGKVQSFGPYTEDKVSLPGKSILGSRPEGDYKITMVGKTKEGTTIKKEATAHIVLWTPPQGEFDQRYSVLYEFNKSKSIAMYEKYLTEMVAPKIPTGATVTLNGYTDITGGEEHNQELSLARANDVKNILEKALAKAGKKDVKFVVNGYGEDQSKSPFANGLPEERFYNRTVIIDIVKK
jgi:outer membrane protein OmpA-like peptidoglycan-associated protein